jgi:mannosyltransferase
MEPRLWRPLLISLILLAFALRIHQLDSFSFWQDEGLTTLRSGYSVGEILSNRITIQEGITKDTHPPAYYLLAHFGQGLLGTSDFSYRFISVLAGVLLVPLLFQLGRRMNGPAVGMLAALVAAVNPLQVWYAQEARMYTLLVLLGAAATYVLWRALTLPRLSSTSLIARMAMYFLLAGLAFYTHYTAIFLLAIQSLFWVWLLWRRGLRMLIIGAAVAGLLVALPMIPATIPRLFTGAETAYNYVPPWIMLQDVVHGFGQGITSHFDQAGIKLLDLGILILLLIGLLGAQKINTDRRLSRVFLLVYLFAAVFGLMIGSLLKPMYLGVRHIIIGSPAFILLAARGVTALPRRPYHLPQLAALALLLSGSFISLLNLYYDPTFAKDDARALVQHIESRAGENDIVVYNNAILLPLHDHYSRRDDLEVTALPIYPHPADARIDEQLSDLAEEYDRLWFVVDPPIDGRDSNGLAASWLDNQLSRIETANFWGVSMLNRVVAYDAGPVFGEAIPGDAHRISSDWEGIPALLGARIDFQEPSSLPTMWIELYWEPSQETSSDLHLRFALRDADDHFWFDISQPARLPASTSALDSSPSRVSYGLQIPAGIPPGKYDLLVQPWDGSDGSQLGEWLSLTSIDFAPSDQWPVEIDWPYSENAPLHFDEAVILLGAVPASQDVRPGHTLPLSIYWQGANSTTLSNELRYQLEVIGPDGSVLSSRTKAPGPAWLSLDQWPDEAVILELSGLYIPPETPPGAYQLRWKLLSGDEAISGRPSWRPWSSESNNLGSIKVTSWPLETTLPQGGEVVEAMFGPAIQLYAYELDSEEAAAGDVLDLTLHWQAIEVPDESYHVFVHLVEVGDDAIVSQSDRIPVDWLRPTNGWRSGEVLSDNHLLALPADIKPGEYQLYIGFFNPDDDRRLPVFLAGEQQQEDRLPLTTIRVLP